MYTIFLAVFLILSTIAYHLKYNSVYYYILKIYTILEYILLSQYLHYIFEHPRAKRLVLYSTVPFLIFCVVSFFVDKAIFSNYPSLVEFLALMMFIIYFFYEKMKTVVEYPIYQSITFWICVGLFLYFAGNFFYVLFINSSKDLNFIIQMKNTYSVVTVCKNILICAAFFATEILDNANDVLKVPNEIELDDFTVPNFKKS